MLATGNPATAETNKAPKENGDKPRLLVPFIRATDEHLERGNLDRTVAAADFASATDLGVHEVPSYGYVTHLYIKVTASGGDGSTTAAVANEDAPFNVLRNVELTEPNGAYIVRFNTGWDLYVANKYGGYVYAGAADPKSSPVFSDVDSNGDFTFVLRIPVAVSFRDGVGALANQDSSGQFKLKMSLAASGTVYDTEPADAGGTSLPSVRVQAWLAAYDQPEPSSANVANETEPPASGTTSFWTTQSGITVASGENNIELKRKGNYIRQFLFILRSGGSRSAGESLWADEVRFLRDAFAGRYYDFDIWRHQMFERTGFGAANESAGGLDDGLRFLDYMNNFYGALGGETRDQWQPTRGSTRLDLAGSFGGSATLDIITNDVAIAQNTRV